MPQKCCWVWRDSFRVMGNALGRDSPGPGRQPGNRKQGVFKAEDLLSNAESPVVRARWCFVAHPAGTFICIYSSWLTCHSPSSHVSIQGIIIYRIIDSRAPYRLSCHVTAPSCWLPPGTRASCLPIHSCRHSLRKGRLSPLFLVFLPCGRAAQDSLSDPCRQWQCPPHCCKWRPRLQ